MPAPSEGYLIRQVASLEDLKAVYEVLQRQFAPPLATDKRLLEDLLRHYPQGRRMMLVAEKGGRIVGGALGCDSILRIIALEPQVRGVGLGRRLIQTYEVAAMRQGVRMISLGAIETAKEFYLHMGYRGKSSMHKELPLPGRVLEHRLARLEAQLGDLEQGQVVQVDETGKIPSLF